VVPRGSPLGNCYPPPLMSPPMNTRYKLTARLNGRRNSVTIYAADDADAILTATFRVMSLAYPNVELWARGAITLTDGKGRVIQTMDAKD